jgi:c-di-GMP-binding flagellar brake protein YcgR
MENVSERRAYARIQLLAYASDKVCTLTIEGQHFTASLVDLSAGGARLHLPQPQTGPKDQPLSFSLRNVADGGLLQNLSAFVRWRDGRELGIQFDPPLQVGVVTLQKLVS